MFQFAEVGGAVRDSLLGVKSKDVDFVAIPKNTEMHKNAEDAFHALVFHLEETGFKIFLETPQFFTVRAQVPECHSLRERTNVADFVLARKDGPSSDGRRPDYVLPGTLMDDLSRRDFTINSMAILDGELIDPFGGQEDLEARLIRFVGDPHDRIAEDGLRVMRALRLSITKNMNLHYYTWEIIDTDFASRMLMKVSIERIRDELEKMFAANTLKTIELLNELNPNVKKSIFRDGLRLMPTLKQ